MAFISTKIIQGKKRYYLEKSTRLKSGKVKKYSLYLKEYDTSKDYPIKDYEQKLDEKIIEDRAKEYIPAPIFTSSLLEQLETMKHEYHRIIKTLSENQLQDVLNRFTVNFTYESNALEGNSLTLKDVTFVMQEGKILHGKNLREIYETLNTRIALEWIFNNKPLLTEKNILTLHKILVKDTGVPLGYKKVPNFLLGRNVETTPPENVEKEMNQLLNWYKNNPQLHPLHKAIIFHGKFEKIHPFEDGNGRVGRLIINIILLSNGYPPLIIRKTQRVKYFHALEAFDHNHMDNLSHFLIQKYKETNEKFFKIYVKYLSNKTSTLSSL